ncbi:thioesterase family protein [Angustibacter peucedani]
MASSFFTAAGAGRYAATEATTGPWSAAHMHGGPPSALLVRESERAAADVTEGGHWQAQRVVLDFLGPVPVAEVEVRAEVVRPGRSAVLVDAELVAGGRPALRSRTWVVRRADDGAAVAPATPDEPPAGPPELAPRHTGWTFGYAEHLEWRLASGVMGEPGPAAAWVRPLVPLVDDEPAAGLAACCLVVDSASGISAELSWDDWSFVNVDLAVHLLRAPVDEWLLMDARTHLSGDRAGLATSTLHDRRGLVGRSSQALVVQPR